MVGGARVIHPSALAAEIDVGHALLKGQKIQETSRRRSSVSADRGEGTLVSEEERLEKRVL